VNQFFTSDEPHHQIQRRTYEPVARRVNGQIREATKDFPSRQESARLSYEDVNAPAYTSDDHLATTVTTSEVSTKPVFNGVGQEARYQIRQIVNVVVRYGVESTPNPREV
jgi:hypothetical protein